MARRIAVDIGFADADELGALWLEADAVAPWLPVRHPRAHKGEAGRVLIVGGAAGMTGAAVLAARGAYRAGAGYVRACVPASVADSLLAAAPELMAVACGETVHRALTTSAEREYWPRPRARRRWRSGPDSRATPGARRSRARSSPRSRCRW